MYKCAITYYYYFKSNVHVIYYKKKLRNVPSNTEILRKKIFDFQKHCHFDH